MAATGAAATTPIYYPGTQPPFSTAEVGALINKGVQATGSAADRRQADAALTQAGLSPEGIAGMVRQGRLSVQDGKLLNDKFNSGVSSYAQRQAGEAAQQQAAALQQMQQAGNGTKDKPNFQSWMEKGDPQRDAQVQAKARELGVSEDAVRSDLETRRRMDFSTPLTQEGQDQQSGIINGLKRGIGISGHDPDSTRTLPDGSIAVNPSLSDDQTKFEQAIQDSNASPEAKEAARKRWPAYHDAWLTQATNTLKASKTLPGIQDYNEWLTSNQLAGHFSEQRPDGSVRQYTDNEKTQLYLDAMKGRSGVRKFMDNVSTSLVAGGGQVVAGLLGAGAMAGNSIQAHTGLNVGGQAISEAAAGMAQQNRALTQSHELTGTIEGPGGQLVSGIVQAVPSIGAAVATGGTAGLVLSATQGAGSTYTDLLEHHMAEGDTLEEAHKKSLGPAIASGAVSLVLSKVMPGGVNALNNPAAREAARKTFGATIKSALKGGAEEISQEALDGGFTHIASEMNKGKTFDQAAASYAEQFPQSALTAALLGGGMQVVADRKNGGGKPTTPPLSVEQSQALIHNVKNLPEAAQQNPKTKANVAQAQQVLQEHVHRLEGQKEPLSEAQAKELAGAKAALARLGPPEEKTTKPNGQIAIQKPKPLNSPDPKKWKEKGGTVDSNWNYIDKHGNRVPYPDGHPDFKVGGHVKAEVEIQQKGNYTTDFSAAKAANGGSQPEGTTWHHHENGTTMQAVDSEVHARFTHRGGVSIKKKGKR